MRSRDRGYPETPSSPNAGPGARYPEREICLCRDSRGARRSLVSRASVLTIVLVAIAVARHGWCECSKRSPAQPYTCGPIAPTVDQLHRADPSAKAIRPRIYALLRRSPLASGYSGRVWTCNHHLAMLNTELVVRLGFSWRLPLG